MENTLENKTKFFSLYYNQNLWFKKDWENFKSSEAIKIDGQFLDTVDENDCIFLKPLTAITDEDAVAISKICGYPVQKEEWDSHYGKYVWDDTPYLKGLKYIAGIIGNNNYKNLNASTHPNSVEFINSVDYLRSKGYVLPFQELTVDTLVEYGWVKLK